MCFSIDRIWNRSVVNLFDFGKWRAAIICLKIEDFLKENIWTFPGLSEVSGETHKTKLGGGSWQDFKLSFQQARRHLSLISVFLSVWIVTFYDSFLWSFIPRYNWAVTIHKTDNWKCLTRPRGPLGVDLILFVVQWRTSPHNNLLVGPRYLL